MLNKFKKLPGRVFKFWKKLGPGLVTGAADDDPSGIATYSQAGARYGLQLLWVSVLTLPLMYIVQEMCARLGMVTGHGIAENIRKHYSKWILFPIVILLLGANTFNIGADLAAMAASSQLIFPRIHYSIYIIFFSAACTFLQIFTNYRVYSKYLKYLTLVLISYIVTGFIVKPDWKKIIINVSIPHITFTNAQLILICAILGTTISPYLFFWQTAHEIEEKIEQGKKTIKALRQNTKQGIKNMQTDTLLGMFISNLIMFFIFIVCSATLFKHGLTDIKSAADAASALKPLAGRWSELLFALGIIGTGLLAIPVLAGSSAYATAELFYWRAGLYQKWHQARGFYSVIFLSMLVALLISFSGMNPMKALIYSAVANAILAPIVLFFIINLTANLQIMGKFRNNLLRTIIGWITLILMSISGLSVIVPLFLKFF